MPKVIESWKMKAKKKTKHVEDNSGGNTEPPDTSDDVNKEDKPYDETISLLKEYLEILSVSQPENQAIRVLIEEGEGVNCIQFSS